MNEILVKFFAGYQRRFPKTPVGIFNLAESPKLCVNATEQVFRYRLSFLRVVSDPLGVATHTLIDFILK
jgi:hypothetical protein